MLTVSPCVTAAFSFSHFDPGFMTPDVGEGGEERRVATPPLNNHLAIRLMVSDVAQFI